MPVVDLAFRLTGDKIPADHGYALLAAISRLIPAVHGDTTIGIHPVQGRHVGHRLLALTDRSRLVFRLDSDRIGEILPLAGQQLDLDGHRIRVGVPETRALRPAPHLRSRLVVIKGFIEPEPFLQAVQRQLSELGIRATPGLPVRRASASVEGRTLDNARRCPYIRRTIRIRDKQVVGYAVDVTDLTAEESIVLQERGLGGRRRFGCGIFVAFKGSIG